MTAEERKGRTQHKEPWFLSDDNDSEEWCITDGVESFPLAAASSAEFALALKGTIERASAPFPSPQEAGDREALTITDEMVETAALALARFVTKSPHTTLPDGPNRDYYRAEAHAVLSAISMTAENVELREKLADAERSLVESKPDPVLVEGSWFPVADLPKILGNFMRSNDDYARQLKDAHLRRSVSPQEVTTEQAWEEGVQAAKSPIMRHSSVTRAQGHDFAVLIEGLVNPYPPLISSTTESEK